MSAASATAHRKEMKSVAKLRIAQKRERRELNRSIGIRQSGRCPECGANVTFPCFACAIEAKAAMKRLFRAKAGSQ